MESKARIAADATDSFKLSLFLTNCIRPLNIDCHTENILCNIVTGEIAIKDVSVNKSVLQGTKAMSDFKRKLSQGFRNTILPTVITMKDNKGKKNYPANKNTTHNPYFPESVI